MLPRKFILILLLACMELASFSGVVRGSIYCRDPATGDSRIENAIEQADCHFQDCDGIPSEDESPDCIDTPLERTVGAEQIPFDSSWVKAFAPLPPALTVFLPIELPAKHSPSGVESFDETCADPARVALRSIVLVI